MKLLARARRRKAGIYLARTRKHRSRRRENGYVGRSNNVPIRIKQHLGQDKRHKAKPWSDLDPQWKVWWLPWWASWKWVQVPLEWLRIKICLPRYNYQHNLTNPRRVPLYLQAIQRENRDMGLAPREYDARTLLTVLGAILVVVGVGMTIWSNL